MPATNPQNQPPGDAALRVSQRWAAFRASIEAELPILRDIPTSRVGHEPRVERYPQRHGNRNKSYDSKLIQEGKP